MLDHDKERIQELSEKWLKGTITQAERQKFDNWFNQHNDEPQQIDLTKQDYRNHLFERIRNETGILQAKRVRLWPKIAVAAAAAIALIIAGSYFFKSPEQPPTVPEAAYANDVAPGKQGATLTLGNGTKINLTTAANGQLAKTSGLTIVKGANGQLTYVADDPGINQERQVNTLTTSRGETYQVTLPDGSKVWLNAASSLTYSSPFKGLNERSVELQGEAYFQVAKDKAHPFIVKHGSQNVEVLGTQFNVSTYAGEPLVTTLEEGSVKIIAPNLSKTIAPGQQAINNNGRITIQQADLEQTLAWKDGNFVYTGAGIKEIMSGLERWYDIEVVYEGPVTSEVFYANISRYKNISQVLKMLEKTKAVHFKINGRRITVKE